jgi:L-serine deaminase
MGRFIIKICKHRQNPVARRVGCYAIIGSAAGGSQYVAMEIAANSDAVSAQRPAWII